MLMAVIVSVVCVMCVGFDFVDGVLCAYSAVV